MKNIEPAFKEALAAFEFFRRLGFSSDQIYILLNNYKGISELFIRLKHLGKTFNYKCGELLPINKEEFSIKWQIIVTAMDNHEFLNDDLNYLYENSFIYKNSVEIKLALFNKGIVAPLRQD